MAPRIVSIVGDIEGEGRKATRKAIVAECGIDKEGADQSLARARRQGRLTLQNGVYAVA